MFGGLIQLAKSLKGVLGFLSRNSIWISASVNAPKVQAALPDGLCVCRFHSLLATPMIKYTHFW